MTKFFTKSILVFGAFVVAFNILFVQTAFAAKVCNSEAPKTPPTLLTVSRNGATAKIHFTAVEKSDYYWVSFGDGHNTSGYGGQINITQTKGEVWFTINALNPKNAYTFMVRAGRKCAPGPWSNAVYVGTIKKTYKP